MARQEIILGTPPTGIGGDTPRVASSKINAMTGELYQGIGTPAAPLPLDRGGTGAKTKAAAQDALGLVPVSSPSDANPAHLVTPGWQGYGGALRTIANTDFNSLPAISFKFIGQSTTNGPESGDFYIDHEYFDSNNANVLATSVTSGRQYIRTKVGTWKAWRPVVASWGEMQGALSNQSDLKLALDSKPSVPTGATMNAFNNDGTAAVLPSGGTYAWWIHQANSSTGNLIGGSSSGVSAGGTAIKAGAPGQYIFGFYWRVA